MKHEKKYFIVKKYYIIFEFFVKKMYSIYVFIFIKKHIILYNGILF